MGSPACYFSIDLPWYSLCYVLLFADRFCINSEAVSRRYKPGQGYNFLSANFSTQVDAAAPKPFSFFDRLVAWYSVIQYIPYIRALVQLAPGLSFRSCISSFYASAFVYFMQSGGSHSPVSLFSVHPVAYQSFPSSCCHGNRCFFLWVFCFGSNGGKEF